MSLQGVSYHDQSNFTNTLPNQKKYCCICLNGQREKTPIWEQDYLLFRKIVKVIAIGITSIGALYLLKTICKAAYNEGLDLGKTMGWRQGRDHAKQLALEKIRTCLDFKTTEHVMECVIRQINWTW